LVLIFQMLKTVQGQDQDRFGQDHDLKKMVLRPVLRTISLVTIKRKNTKNEVILYTLNNTRLSFLARLILALDKPKLLAT